MEETLETQPRTLNILEANLEQIKCLNDMIQRHLEKGTPKSSLVIRQMEYQKEKFIKEINEYLQVYKVSLIME